MGPAIGQSLPIAVGVLISPLPIVAVVLMLVSRRAAANGTAFVLGWFLAVLVVTTVVAVALGSAADDESGTPTWVSVVKIVLGALLLVMAAGQWRGRPRGGAEAPTPKWMAAIDSFTPVKAFGLAVLLSAVNPKNLVLLVSGGAAIASAAGQDSTARLVASVVFALVASLGVLVPLVAYLVMGERAAHLLDELKTFMISHNAAIMTVLLLVIGAKLVGDGLTTL